MEKKVLPLQKTRREGAAQIDRLLEMMAALRAEDGCPWDREQTLETLQPYLIEEAYEVLDAMEGGGREHCEELGDLLFQIVFQAEIAREKGAWDFGDVVRAIGDKIESRHPHVFGDAPPEDLEESNRNWVRRKAEEKARKHGRPVSVIDGVPRHAPALLRAERTTEKASRIGFDWPDVAGVRAKVDEELGELDAAIAAGDREAVVHELGDVLFSLANLARHLETPAEGALRLAVRRFEKRFLWLEGRLQERGVPVGEAVEPDLLEELWAEAKAAEQAGDL